MPSPAPTAGRMRVGTNPDEDADDDDADDDADPPRTREIIETSEEEEAALVSSLKYNKDEGTGSVMGMTTTWGGAIGLVMRAKNGEYGE